MTQTVSLSFFRFQTFSARFWAFVMMGLGRGAFARVPDIGFRKMCGSGTGEGFTPTPNTAVYALLATWPDLETAKAQVETNRFFTRYRAKSAESWTVFLCPTSSRGNWAGRAPFTPSADTKTGRLAVLTRATIKPSVLLKFWRRVPDISKAIGLDQNVAFKIGIGEIPWVHQVTFSIWPDTTAMAEFARKDGPHAKAIKAVRDGDWFREELYARFAITGDSGTWGGSSPLKRLDLP